MQNKKIVSVILMMALFLWGAGKNVQAVPQNNGSAELVVGQQNFTGKASNQGGGTDANTLAGPWDSFYDGTRFFVADTYNHRVLIYNSLPTSNNARADVVVGQPNMTANSANQGLGGATSRTLQNPCAVYSDGTRLFISDHTNHRVLIYNTIPTSNNAEANIVIGQPDMTHNSVNAGGAITAKTLNYPNGIFVSGSKLFITDQNNSRVLVFNNIPSGDYASANFVIGQADTTHGTANQGGAAGANTLNAPTYAFSDGTKLAIVDRNNNRVLVFNSIPTDNNASANVVIGQSVMSGTTANQGGSVSSKTLSGPWGVTGDGTHLFISDGSNHRILIYNSIPTSNNTGADSVIGQISVNDGTSYAVAANTLTEPYGIQATSTKLFASDDSLNDGSRVTFYKLRPTLAEVTPIGSTTSTTPSYTFSSDEDGTISYSGDCSGTTTSATAGNNTITLNSLALGTYSNCTLQVTNGSGFTSSTLAISSFTISLDDSITLSPSNAPYSNKKSTKRKVTITIKNFNLSKKAKKSWVKVRINNRKMKITSLRNSGADLRVAIRLAYGKWGRADYNLSMTYKNKNGRAWDRGSFAKTNAFTVY